MKIFFKKRCKVVKLYFYTILVDEIVDFLTSPLERETKHCKKKCLGECTNWQYHSGTRNALEFSSTETYSKHLAEHSTRGGSAQ